MGTQIMSDCMPFAIHVISGVEMPKVMEIVSSLHPECRWSPDKGMSAITAWCVLRDLGVKVMPYTMPEERTTLSKFISSADGRKTYLVVVNDHVLTLKNGVVFDKAKTHRRTVVEGFIEIE